MHQLLIKLIERIILLAEKVDPSLKAEFDQIIVELENQQTAPQTSPATPASPPVPQDNPVPVPVASNGNPFVGAKLYVKENSAAAYIKANPNDPNVKLLEKIANQPVAEWLVGGTPEEVAKHVSDTLTAANGQLVTFVSYDIPNRDDGGPSSGGAADANAYAGWEGAVDYAIDKAGNPPVVLIHEPDALGNAWNDKDYTKLSELQVAESELVQHPNRTVYLDVPMWNAPSIDAMVAAVRFLIEQDKMKGIRGFALNTSGYNSDASCHAFGDALCQAFPDQDFHYIVDTSRNANGGQPGQWENVPGQGLGALPLSQPATQYFDGNIWCKVPGESDGPNNGHKAAGVFDYELAVELARNAK